MTNVNERTITADEDCMLTNGTVYAKSVRLGDWDSANNWHEVSVEEYEAKMAQNNAATEEIT